MPQKKDTSIPAFPQNDAVVNRINNEAGMTLRDYFAGQALAEIATDSLPPQEVAEWAYDLADAMIAQREK